MKEIDLKEIQYKLYDSLKDSGWSNILKVFILSDEFLKILDYLWEESYNNRKFTPILKQLFRAFTECPYDDLRVVIVGQDPYPQIYAADGIAFSCSNKDKIEVSLKFIFQEIQKTVYHEKDYVRDKDLKRWSNQGILLLNTALTTEIRKIGKHVEIWKPFINFLFDQLNSNKQDLIYVFMGKKAESFTKSINEDKNNIIITSHPASGAYRGKKGWESNDLFNKINQKLKDPIVW